jgi:hypothetical protein
MSNRLIKSNNIKTDLKIEGTFDMVPWRTPSTLGKRHARNVHGALLHTYYCTHITTHILLHIYYCTYITAHILLNTYYCTHITAHILLHIYYCKHITAHILLHTYDSERICSALSFLSFINGKEIWNKTQIVLADLAWFSSVIWKEFWKKALKQSNFPFCPFLSSCLCRLVLSNLVENNQTLNFLKRYTTSE